MTITEALDIIFDWLPTTILKKLKNEDFYQPILSGQIKTGAELYDFLTPAQARWQDANYNWLISALAPLLNRGSTLQIGCGRGDLLKRLAEAKFKPLYGLDRSAIMLAEARTRLSHFKRTRFIQANINKFDWRTLPTMNNIIINNFWGLLTRTETQTLLENLKFCTNEKSLIIIGPYNQPPKSPARLRAEKLLQTELGFIFSFPFSKNFSGSGYTAKIIMLNRRPYFLLKRKSPVE